MPKLLILKCILLFAAMPSLGQWNHHTFFYPKTPQRSDYPQAETLKATIEIDENEWEETVSRHGGYKFNHRSDSAYMTIDLLHNMDIFNAPQKNKTTSGWMQLSAPTSLHHADDLRLLDSFTRSSQNLTWFTSVWDSHLKINKGYVKSAYHYNIVATNRSGAYPQTFVLRLTSTRENRNRFLALLQPLLYKVEMKGREPLFADHFFEADSVMLVHHKEQRGWTNYNSFQYEKGSFDTLVKARKLQPNTVLRTYKMNDDDFAQVIEILDTRKLRTGYTWSNSCFYPQHSLVFFKNGLVQTSMQISFGCRRYNIIDHRVVQRAQIDWPLTNAEWELLRRFFVQRGFTPDEI